MKKVRLLPLSLCLLLLAGIFTGCAAGNAANANTNPTGSPAAADDPFKDRQLTQAATYDDIYKALKAAESYWYGGVRDDGMLTGSVAPGMGVAESAPMPAAEDGKTDYATESNAGASGQDYSQTNVQVQGIDEGDIVKTDGQYIYVLRQNELIIMKADGADTVRIGSIKIAESNNNGPVYEGGVKSPEAEIYIDEYASDIYVSGNTAVVISSYSSYTPYYYDDIGDKAEIMPPTDNRQIAKVHIIDITDRTKPLEKAELGQDGYVLTSRLVGNKLYLISNYYVYSYQEGDSNTFIPRLYANGAEKTMSAGSIAIMPFLNSTAYTVVCAYDLDQAALGESQSVLGGGSTVYMNKDALFIASSTSTQTESAPYTDSVYTVIDYTTTNVTDITRFDLSGGGLKLSASGTIPGNLYSQFALDEYDGYLRVAATTYNQSWSEYTDKEKGFVNYIWKDPVNANALYILDSNLKTVGSIGDLAPGEQVYSVRFDGTVGYIVTFRQVDPLFAVDLSDPSKPAVMSALKIPGFSQYLHVWGDGRLFGLGMDADAETGRANGMKLAMFDTTDPFNVTEKNTLKLDTSWSNALYNHKAILISAEKNLIAFPADSGYDIYSYTDEAGFRQLAHIDSIDWNGDSRGLYIGDFAYIVDSSAIFVLDFDGFKLVDKISY